MPSWMLSRLKRETQAHHHAADGDRLLPLHSVTTTASYRRYLSRIYGFEAPVEQALRATRGLDEIVHLGTRDHVQRIAADLQALGIADLSALPQVRLLPFITVADALGWLYVIEHNAAVHADLRMHLEKRIPDELATAGRYLCGGAGAGTRLAELGAALDRHAARPDLARQIVESAKTAFRRQRQWYAQALPATHARPTQVA